jgi:hypothetical protein
MAESFKNAYLDVTNSAQTAYTNSSGGQTVIYTCRVTNVHASSADTITCEIFDASSGSSKIANNMTINPGASQELAGQSKLNLEIHWWCVVRSS